jgi:uncharacterized membrane protein
VAFGSNVTHLFWLFSANGDPISGAEKLRVVKIIDDRLAVPSYVITIGAGIAMWLWQWPAGTSWIVASLALSVVLAAMGIAFGPFMYRWIRLAAEQPPGEPRLALLSRRLTIWWGAITFSVLVILYLMIWKPTLW